MRQLFVILGLFMLISASFAAFEMNDYLYPNENPAGITTEELSTSPSSTLYYVDGVPTALTSNDNLVEDHSGIEQILNEHYAKTLLPSNSDLASLKADLKKFNDSRNFQLAQFGGGAEKLCVQETLLEVYDCKSSIDCMAATMKCFLWIQNGGGSCYAELLSPLFYSYNTEVKKFDPNMNEIYSLLSKLDLTNANQNLEQVRTKISTLKSAAAIISKNDVGGLQEPINENSFGLCSVTHLDVTALTNADSKVVAMQGSLGKISTVSTTANAIFENTKTRLNYKKGTALLAVWKPKWDAFKDKNQNVRAQSLDYATYVKDTEFTSQFTKFDTAWTSMEARMTSYDFDGVDSDLENLQGSSAALQKYMNSSAEHPYKKAVAAANDATDAVIYAKYNVRTEDPAAVSAYNSLTQKKNQIDAKLKPPMTSAQYTQITAEYTALITEADSFVQSQIHIEDSVSSAGGAFGQTAINAVFSLTDALYAMPPAEKETVAPVIPPIVLFMLDLAAVSVLIVVFVGVAVKFKHVFRKRAILGIWVVLLLVFLFLLGAGSVMMFILIDQSAKSATLQEFTTVISNSNAAYVLVNKDSVPDGSVAPMLSCAQNISSQIKAEYGKTAGVFEVSGNSCKYDGKDIRLDECMNMAGSNPILNLYYASTPSAQFYTVYQKKADIRGDATYYQRCELGDVLH